MHLVTDAIVLRPLAFPQDEAAFMAHLRALYPSISEDTLRIRLENVRQGSWECIVALEGNGAAKMAGMSGYWIQHRLCYGRFLYVDHFIVSDVVRSRGVGNLMWRELERIARESGCTRIVLDTYVTNSVAQRFWMNQGCNVVGFHFGKPLEGSDS